MDTKTKLLMARLASRAAIAVRRLRGLDSKPVVRRGGVNWRLDLAEGIDLSIFLLGGFELRALALYRKILKPGDIVIDVGANVGAHTLPLATLVGPGGKVHAVEPTDYAFAKLLDNIALNPGLAARIVAHHALIAGADDAQIPEAIYSSWPLDRQDGVHVGHGGRLHATSGSTTSTLDKLVSTLGRRSLALLKIDVDGAELAVLEGGAETLRQMRPKIMIELAPHVYARRRDFDLLLSLLWDAGYELTLSGGKRTAPRDADKVRAAIPKFGAVNAVAVHRDCSA